MEIIADLNDKEGIEKVFNLTCKAFDKLDVLVNNAGLGFAETIETVRFLTYFVMKRCKAV